MAVNFPKAGDTNLSKTPEKKYHRNT